MPGVVHRPGEGEALFGGRIVIKANFDELCITESLFPDARPGADPHFHRQHADSFYVLEGGLAVLVDDEEKMLSPGACVCAPPEVVHGFRSTSRARFLNFHTPNGGFARNLQERDRGEPGGFDSVDAPPGSGLPGSDAIFLLPGEGERLEGQNRIATIKIGREELALIEFELEPGFDGPDPHNHDDHVDSFYVLEGEPEFLVDDERLHLGAGSYVAAPIGVVHTFSNPGPERARLLNVHAPSRDFHESLRRMSRMTAGLVHLTVVPNAYEAELLVALLRTEGLTCDLRPTNLGVGMMDGLPGGGPKEIVVAEQDLARAQEILAASRND